MLCVWSTKLNNNMQWKSNKTPNQIHPPVQTHVCDVHFEKFTNRQSLSEHARMHARAYVYGCHRIE